MTDSVPYIFATGTPLSSPSINACLGCGVEAPEGPEVHVKWINGETTTERICATCEPRYASYLESLET